MQSSDIQSKLPASIRTSDPDFVLRFACAEDTGTIMYFIKELAHYEKMESEVAATEENIRETLFVHKCAEVIIAEYQMKPVGFLLYFYNYSTFLGQPGIYLEDLYLVPEVRNMGFGRMILAFLAQLAIDRSCGRIEWSCLDWNLPSRRFYDSIGANAKDEWIGYRLSGKAMTDLADKAREF